MRKRQGEFSLLFSCRARRAASVGAALVARRYIDPILCRRGACATRGTDNEFIHTPSLSAASSQLSKISAQDTHILDAPASTIQAISLNVACDACAVAEHNAGGTPQQRVLMLFSYMDD